MENAATKKTTYREALKQGLREALQNDERVFLMGKTGDTAALLR
jgi:pyruvate dehydrogenase E1 component beta subunit